MHCTTYGRSEPKLSQPVNRFSPLISLLSLGNNDNRANKQQTTNNKFRKTLARQNNTQSWKAHLLVLADLTEEGTLQLFDLAGEFHLAWYISS